VWPLDSANRVCSRLPLTLTFDRLTLKLVCESHLRWGTFLPNLGSTYSLCTRQTDRQMDRHRRTKATLSVLFPTVRGIIIMADINWNFSRKSFLYNSVKYFLHITQCSNISNASTAYYTSGLFYFHDSKRRWWKNYAQSSAEQNMPQITKFSYR